MSNAEPEHGDDEPVVATVDVQVVLREQWDALGRKVLRLEPNSGRVADLTKEFYVLACAVAWLEANGNITLAAQRVGTGRASLRKHVKIWTRQNPGLVPSRPVKPPTSKPRESKATAQTRKLEAHAPEDGT